MDSGNLELESYLANAKEILLKFETALSWEPPDIGEASEPIISDATTCPFDKEHKIPKGKLELHTKKCKWRKLGYSHAEIQEILYNEERTRSENNPIVINSDSIISQIAPSAGLIRSDQRYKSTLNCEQRLAVYEAEVSRCYSANKPLPDKALYADLEAKTAEILYQKENPENLSKAELLQKLRDMKRRRQSYRAKNVHITKRSQTEIIRGVLEVHMEELRKMWNKERQDLVENSQDGERRMQHPRERRRSRDREPALLEKRHRGDSATRIDRRYAESPREHREDARVKTHRREKSSPSRKHSKIHENISDDIKDSCHLAVGASIRPDQVKIIEKRHRATDTSDSDDTGKHNKHKKKKKSSKKHESKH